MIVPLTLDLARTVARRLRERDRRELLALEPELMRADPALASWAEERVEECAGACWAAITRGDPVAIGGMLRGPGIRHAAVLWLFGTDGMAYAVPEIITHIRQAVHPQGEAAGIRKFQAQCLADQPPGESWLLRVGYRHEGTIAALGAQGESFHLFGRVAGD